MALAKAGANGSFDVSLEGVAPEVSGHSIVRQLSVKGFCVVNAGFEEGLLSQACSDCGELEFYQVSEPVKEGLLGADGSGFIADLETQLEDEARSEGEALRALDNTITRLASAVEPHLGMIRFAMTHRSYGVVHRSGEPEDDPPQLTEQEVTKWQNQFMRHRVMVLIFLGPKSGSLELQPLNIEDAEPFEIKTQPGMMVALCADSLAHKYAGPSDSYCISSFFMTKNLNQGKDPASGYPATPASRKIQDWFENKLQDLKAQEDVNDPVWDGSVPRSWQKAVNHMFCKGQMTGIGGIGCHLPSTYDAELMHNAGCLGADYAIEIPLTRWNHADWYDENPDGWMFNKTNCKHMSHCDGIELFDNKFFSLSPNESRSFDPQNRSMLEISYAAMHNMGLSKKYIMNKHGGVFVGCGNLEWAFPGDTPFGFFGGVTGTMCMQSGRVSFCLGMKGPALSITSEAASGMAAIYLSAESVQSKGTAPPCEFSTAIGVNFGLGPWDYPLFSKNGWLCNKGRCLTFDSSASGYIRGDACTALSMKTSTEIIDGQVIPKEGEHFYGIVAGAMMMNAGQGASITSPNGPAEQECMVAAIKNAHIAHEDVDGFEAFGNGAFLADAIESSSIWRAHRNDTEPEVMNYLATKTTVGNQIDASGPMQVIKIMWAALKGKMTPNLHLRQCNPHTDCFEQPFNVITDLQEFPFRSTYNAAFAKGTGGSMADVMMWGTIDDKLCPPPPELQREPVTFWPGGGGELDDDKLPSKRDAYYLSGTWCAWSDPVLMRKGKDEGVYNATIVLGENRWEKFQIWCDSDADKALYPDCLNAPAGSTVLGPGPDGDIDDQEVIQDVRGARAPCWMIDGRVRQFVAKTDALALTQGVSSGTLATKTGNDVIEVDTEDTGMPGDEYEVTLNVNGKWRMVSWTKKSDGALLPVPRGRYFICGSWNDWAAEEMTCEDLQTGTYSIDVKLNGYDCEFQIVRDCDWCQVFYPGQDGVVEGPDDWDLAYGRFFRPGGRSGENAKITFQRSKDATKVSWSVTPPR